MISTRRDLFPCEQGLDQLVPEYLHEADRIRARDCNQRTIRGNQTVSDQTVQMGMKPGGIVTVALQRGDHAGNRAAIPGAVLKQFLDGGVEALAQQAQELTVVLEAELERIEDQILKNIRWGEA
jgi:hypothetical protein